MRYLAALAVLSLLAAGCGGDDDEPSAAGTTASAAGCTPADSALMTPLSNLVTAEGVRLNGGRIARGADGTYFVSVEVDGPGYEDTGDVATWATESTGGAGAVYSVDELARKISSWRQAEAAGIDVGDPAVAASRACVSG